MVVWIIEIPGKVGLEVKGKVNLGEFEAAPRPMDTEGFQKAAATGIRLLIAHALDVLRGKTNEAVRLQDFRIGIIDPDPVMLQAPLVTGDPGIGRINTFWNQIVPELPVQKVHLRLPVKVDRKADRVDGVAHEHGSPTLFEIEGDSAHGIAAR